MLGALCATVGGLAAAVPDWLANQTEVSRLFALRAMFLLYGAIGLLVWWLYRRPAAQHPAAEPSPSAPLGPSRRVVVRLAALLNTMVFTHIPANVCLVLAALTPSLPLALALLFVRSALSQMDVPTRTAYVMAVVTPAERAAAGSFTAVPRSLAAALSPALSGALFAAGWISLPLVGCGLLKIAYDLALWRSFRTHTVEDE